MKKEDRVARLEALLARVKANTAARGERPRSLLSYRPAEPSDADGTAPFPMRVGPRVIPDEMTLEALSQRALVLIAREGPASSPPIAIVRAPSTPGHAIPPPPPSIEEDAWPPSVHPPAIEPDVAPARDFIVEEPAPMGLERAVRDAAAERLDPLLREAALDLRDHERKTEPPVVPEAEDDDQSWREISRLPPLPQVDEESEQSFDALDAAFHPPPPPPQAPAPAESGRWMLWAGVAAGAALVLAATSLLGNRDQPATKERATGSTPTITTSVSDVAPPPRSATPPPTGPAAEPAPAPSASVMAARPIDPVPDPPDVSGLGVGRGLLWVEASSPREIFVIGNQVGASGKWLNVPCGLRNVRSAKQGPPPAGASFPMWTSDGHSVLVPCRSYTRVTMPTDP
ncbi:MAG: hypothetical protein HOV80_36355 [Polyangiaceae bacterium]|nr:hypothetical protein [Polyangiaceae bacterium]